MIDVNELKTGSKSLFIAGVEHNTKSFNKPDTNIRDSWLQSYTLQDKFLNAMPENNGVKATPMDVSNEISAIEAVSRGLFEGDIRPKIFDKTTKEWTLLDSGSVVSCIPKKPGDKMDTQFRLRSVNGGSIATFGRGDSDKTQQKAIQNSSY